MCRGQMHATLVDGDVLPEEIGPHLKAWGKEGVTRAIGQHGARKVQLPDDVGSRQVQLTLDGEG